MYSHKRSFTGQSSRSLVSLFDVPFLITTVTINALFSLIHSLTTFAKLEDHIRILPSSLAHLNPEDLTAALRSSAASVNLPLLASVFIGLTLPLLMISVSVRFALASLRVSVQRTVTICYLIAFYMCSVLTVALQQPDWTPGNILIFLAKPFGKEFFESLRAILCLSLIAGAAVTLIKNATSKTNRRIRVASVAACIVVFLSAEHLMTESKRKIHSSFLKSPSTAKFIYVVPELTKTAVQEAFKTSEFPKLKEQLTSFQEIEPSTSSLVGQFATTFLGLEPITHGIRHDNFGEDTRLNVMTNLTLKTFPSGNSLYVATVGAPTSAAQLFPSTVPGQRCDSNLTTYAKIGQFQASVVPYSLLPRSLDEWLHPELACSTRFLTAEQHLVQLHQKIAVELHTEGNKIFVIWLSEALKRQIPSIDTDEEQKINSLTAAILRQHVDFLERTDLMKYHQTFLVGLAGPDNPITIFARFDGQAQTSLTDLTLASPGHRSQSSVSPLFQPDSPENSQVNSFFYSEYAPAQITSAAAYLPPKIVYDDGKSHARLVVDHAQLREALVKGQRTITCKSVSGSSEKEHSLVTVTLKIQSEEAKIPSLTYQFIPQETPTSLQQQIPLSACLDAAREQLLKSLYEDVTLRDSSAFKTLLSGLTVHPIRTGPETTQQFDGEQKELDTATSSMPAHPAYDLEE